MPELSEKQLADLKKRQLKGVTSEEIDKALQRKHDLDDQKFINKFKKIFDPNTKWKKGEVQERANKVSISKVSDGWMFKLEIEGFIHGTSMGTRMFKFYTSDTVKEALEVLLDKFPKKSRIDPRSGDSKKFPRIVKKEEIRAEELLDIDNLWGDISVPDKDKDEDIDIWTA